MTKSNEKVERLAAILAGLGSDATFTERQAESRGTVRTDAEVDAAVHRVVRAMRERYGFETALSDDDLVHVVRGYYRGTTDERLAADVGAGADDVAGGRVALHLFRPTDLDAPFDLDALRTADEDRDAAGDPRATDDQLARTLGIDPATVRRCRSVLDARREARRVSYRYPAEFAALLDVDDDEALADIFLTDRRLMDLVTQ
ncbi:conditioned medium-induced protein 4 [Halomarina litorea]|uniref:conditioned medium-induced protein 4 n=1 Tax=Halomarina litorea TaxID=2961595 RepID=UPI0020C4FBD7|nr:conditioned medium-induced protein 4 [Halomarina sp. BCD28]